MKCYNYNYNPTSTLTIFAIGSIIVLIEVLQLSLVTAVSNSYTVRQDESSTKYNVFDNGDNTKVIKMDLHPASSYVRWLQLQLEDVDSQLAKEQDKKDETGGVESYDRTNRGSLRRLEDDEQQMISSDDTKTTTFLNNHQETNTDSSNQQQLLHDERELIQQQNVEFNNTV